MGAEAGGPAPLRGYLAAGVVVLCWSGFNIVSRLGATGSLAPTDLAALRFGISGLIALPFFVRWVPLAHWPRYLALALLGVGSGFRLPRRVLLALGISTLGLGLIAAEATRDRRLLC